MLHAIAAMGWSRPLSCSNSPRFLRDPMNLYSLKFRPTWFQEVVLIELSLLLCWCCFFKTLSWNSAKSILVNWFTVVSLWKKSTFFIVSFRNNLVGNKRLPSRVKKMLKISILNSSDRFGWSNRKMDLGVSRNWNAIARLSAEL